MQCFGAEISSDMLERADRFTEEALELAQTMPGFTATRAHALVDYVFGRDVGERQQEVGGVMVTLAALCLAADIDMHEAGEIELARILQPHIVEKIRAKQAAKPTGSALPVAHPPAAEPVGLREAVAREARAAEMSANLMRDRNRTGGWQGAARTADAFDRIARALRQALTTPARTDDAGVGGPGWDVDGMCDDHGRFVCSKCALSPAPDRGEVDAEHIERAAQWLHDEGGFGDAWSNYTWPEHRDDTGQRDGGFVKIVPSDVQAKFREVATRMLRVFPAALKPADATPAGEAVQMAVPADVAALVVAGRQIMERGYVSISIEEERVDSEALTKALDAFASRVCWDDEGGELPDAHADPCTCGQQGGSGE
ncbi:hypothetical protein U5A82_18350 [Sphingobium sp. CR2-8]|nr:hypothetical protein [Sphingobium sp. CR2-8]MEC3912363.1 hypothetical protein [Sphingobium sp. CR2-8]